MIQKLVATIIIISLILSVGLNIFLFKPKKAQAIFGAFDITAANLVDDLKEWIIDEIPRRIARHMVLRLQQEITRWAQGGFTDENKPFALLKWKDYLLEALDFASAKFIEDFHLTPLCAPFRFTIGQTLGFAQPRYVYPPYRIYAACSISRVVDNVETFWRNPKISAYGWDVWTALSQPQNNIFGSVILAALRKSELENEEIKEKEVQKDTGQGYMNENECIDEAMLTDEQMQECGENCTEKCGGTAGVPMSGDAQCVEGCLQECQARGSGICLEYSTKNIGSTIHSSIEKSLGSDFDWLITADEITQLFGLVFSSLFNKLYHGTGLAAQPYYRAAQTSVSKYQAEYGYYNQYKQDLTPEDIHDLRVSILDNILKAIQNITTKAFSCDNDYQLTDEPYSEMSAEIIEEESKHLYVGYEGVDLKPDYEVLDPPNAPFAVFGTTWDEIPFNKYPEKCANITGTTCPNIITNLPYELDKSNILDGNCSDCLSRINELRAICKSERDNCLAQCPVNDTVCSRACRDTYTACENNAINTAVSENRCANFDYGSTCLNGAKLIDRTQNRCDTCVEEAQKRCENIEDASEKESCIELYCSDYEDIEQDWGQTFTDASDFYNRCQTAEIRDACYICLKEYFMPSKYCGVVADFVNRGFVKYPAQVYDDLWWGQYYSFDTTCQESNRTTPGTIPTGLLCRILPDFGGANYCATSCDATEEELRNVFDDQPRDDECNPRETYTGGNAGAWIWYMINKKTKCCAALTGHIPDGYSKCRGQEGEVEELNCDRATLNEKGYCYCELGQRGLVQGDFHNFREADHWECRPPDDCPDGGVYCGTSCKTRSFSVPNNTSNWALSNLIVRSNAQPAGSVVAISTGGCSINEHPSDACTDGLLETECSYTASLGGVLMSGTGDRGLCQIDTNNRGGSVGHCIPWDSEGAVGGARFTCDVSGFAGGSLNMGIYNNDRTDGVTGMEVCLPCDPCDEEYPNYGYATDQCNMKLINHQIVSQARETCN